MDIESSYTLEIKKSPKSTKTIEKIINDLIEFDMKYYAKIAFNLDGTTRERVSWGYDEITNLFVPFSINNMDVLLIVTEICDLNNSHQRMYFFQGKHYIDQGVIVYPDFDKKELA